MFFLVTGLVCMVIMVLGAGQFAAMIPNPGAKLSIMCLAPAVLTCCLMSAYRGYYQGMQNMYPTSISQIIEAVTKMIFGLGLSGAVLYLTKREYQNTQTVLGVSYSSYEQAQAVIAQIASAAAVLGVSLSTVAGLLYLVFLWKRKGDGVQDSLVMHAPKPEASSQILKKIVMIGVPVCMGSLAVNLSGFIDMMTVTGRLDDVMNTAPQALLSGFGELIPQIEVTNQTVHNYLYGAYTGKAEVIANLVPALTAGLAVSALPAVAESFARNNRLRTQKSVQMVLRMTAIICIPAGLGISVLSEEICQLFFGYSNEVAIGAPLLAVLGIASIFIAMTATTNSLLQAVGKVSLPVKLIVLGSIGLVVWNLGDFYPTLEETVRHAAFQVSSIITTTGFATTDFDLWPSFSRTILLCLMVIGACAGSTGGGLKVARVLLLFKSLKRNIAQMLHPRKVQVIRNNGSVVSERIVANTNAYLCAYVVLMFGSFVLISLDGYSVGTNFSAVLSCLNNIGPGLELAGPTCNFSIFSTFSKLVLILDMLLGRLEVFPMLMLFYPPLWKESIGEARIRRNRSPFH